MARRALHLYCGRPSRPNEPTKDLHCARGHVIAFHAGGFTWCPCFRDRYFNAPLPEINRQGEPDRPATNDQLQYQFDDS
jgi:hypothetical protein